MDGVTNPPTGSPRRCDSLNSLAAISENHRPAFAEKVSDAVLGPEVDPGVEDSASEFSGLNVDDTGPTPVPTPRTDAMTPQGALSWEGFFGAGRGQSPMPGPADDFLKRLQVRNAKRMPTKTHSEAGADSRLIVLHLDDVFTETMKSKIAFGRDPYLKSYQLLTASALEGAKSIIRNHKVSFVFTDIEVEQRDNPDGTTTTHGGLDLVEYIRTREADVDSTANNIPVYVVSTRSEGDQREAIKEDNVSTSSSWNFFDGRCDKQMKWEHVAAAVLKRHFPDVGSQSSGEGAAMLDDKASAISAPIPR